MANNVPQVSKTRNKSQLLRGFALGLVLVPTLLIVVGAFMGYRLVSIQGTSMEPTLRHGDALWAKHLKPADVKEGDIVTLQYDGKLISHRVVGIEPLSDDSYLLVTKGDANVFTEEGVITADGTAAVLFARVRCVGYALEFLGSAFARGLLIGFAILVAIQLWRQLRGIKKTKKGVSYGDSQSSVLWASGAHRDQHNCWLHRCLVGGT